MERLYNRLGGKEIVNDVLGRKWILKWDDKLLTSVSDGNNTWYGVQRDDITVDDGVLSFVKSVEKEEECEDIENEKCFDGLFICPCRGNTIMLLICPHVHPFVDYARCVETTIYWRMD